MEAGARFLTSTDLAVVSTVKTETLGTIGNTADGRRYRYAQFGGAVTGGNLVIGPSLVANHQNIAVAVAAPIAATQVSVTLGATAATQDQYAEGYLVVGVSGSAVPVIRKVKGNTSGAANATITVLLDDREPLTTALTTSNVVSLSPSMYLGATASSTTGYPLGIATVSATSGQYGWIQAGGPALIVNDAAAALTALTKVKQSTTVAGAVVASSAATDIQVGVVIQPAATSAASLVNLTLS